MDFWMEQTGPRSDLCVSLGGLETPEGGQRPENPKEDRWKSRTQFSKQEVGSKGEAGVDSTALPW